MDRTQDFKSLQDQIQTALLATTRVSSQISSEDLGFQRSLDPKVGTSLDEQTTRLLELSSGLLKSAASIAELQPSVLEDADDVDSNWHSIVDIVDSLLEKTDTCLDEYTGVIKRKETPTAEHASPKPRNAYSLGSAFRTQNIVKPQLAFDVKPDNNDTSPWKPLLTTKPHALQPLGESLGIFTNDFDQPQYRHPYETEILQMSYPKAVYQKADPIPYLPVETTSAIFVDTLAGVLEMLEELKNATEIAVDLEHHDTRSYVGLVSLMQISTRHKDWIIDTLKPWRQSLQVLNQVFADPTIVKVFHGAYMDIVWLQRDLGLYVVGLFDTHHASRTLGYHGGSLAFLLKKFINFDADKKYQMADWRIRPLPDEMFYYARADTHFLLYIYDNMRNELIDKANPEAPEQNCTELVLQKSKETSLLRFERQVYNMESGKGPGGWYQLLVKTPALFSNEQFAVFRAVHAWRDQVARLDDDSTAFVMPNHVIFSIAKLLPLDMVALLAIAHPISHTVKSRSGELLDLIKTARAQGQHGPSMMDVLRPDSVGAVVKANLAVGAAKSAPTPLLAVVDESNLVSEQSSFWGGAFGSSIWDAPTFSKKEDELRLAVPLPQLSSEIFATSNGLADRSREKAKSSIQDIQPITPASNKSNESFILKRGLEPKGEVQNEPEETTSKYDDAPNSSEDHGPSGKATSKAERRAARKLRKQQRKSTTPKEAEPAGPGEVVGEEPFDYSKAQSVLHGKRKGGEQGGPKSKKPFDPYAKSADAPKGMRRLQSEREGKSHTFKS